MQRLGESFEDEELEAFEDLLRRIRTEAAVKVYLKTVTLEEAEALAEAIHGNPLLESLDLEDSALGPWQRGGLMQVEALAGGLRGSSVTMLGLSNTGLEDAGAKAVAAILKETSLQSLDLEANGIGAAGAHLLAEALKSSSVTSLSLYGNSIGDSGAGALAFALGKTSLELLNLGSNRIGAAGARALAAALKDSNVTGLGLLKNLIGARGGEALLWGLRESPVVELKLSHAFDSDIREETLLRILETLEANKAARTFILQMEVRKSENEVHVRFRTLAGTDAAVLQWSLEHPVQDLPKAVLSSMRSSGFQPPFKGLSVFNLRLVRPDGAILDVGKAAAPLAQQLGFSTEPAELAGPAGGAVSATVPLALFGSPWTFVLSESRPVSDGAIPDDGTCYIPDRAWTPHW